MITCAFENGNKASLRHVVVHMIVEKDGCILLEKRDGPILETGKGGLPSGFLERDETASQCAMRELKEETGLSAKNIKIIGHYYLGPGHHSQECKVFLAEGLTEGESNLEEGETESGLKTMKTTPKKLEEMIGKENAKRILDITLEQKKKKTIKK